MKEITLEIDIEIAKAKEEYQKAIESKDKEKIEETQGLLGNLEVIKEEHGNFKITFKKYNAREQAILQEMALGIRGGVKTSSAGVISNPSIVNAHINSVKFGVKNIEPMIFDFRNDNAIGELDKTLDDWIYDKIDVFNSKNWMFRQTVG